MNSRNSQTAGSRNLAPNFLTIIPVVVPEVVDVIGGAAPHGSTAIEVCVGAVLVERLEDGVVAQLDVGQEGPQVLYPTATT